MAYTPARREQMTKAPIEDHRGAARESKVGSEGSVASQQRPFPKHKRNGGRGKEMSMCARRAVGLTLQVGSPQVTPQQTKRGAPNEHCTRAAVRWTRGRGVERR